MAEPEPWQGAAPGDPPSPLPTSLSQLHLRAPVPAMEDLGAQASLSKDLPQGPWLPELLGCLGPPLRLQWRGACTPKLPVHTVSLAEGRGERTLLRFLHLEAWRERLSSSPLPWGTPSIGGGPQGPALVPTLHPPILFSAFLPHPSCTGCLAASNTARFASAAPSACIAVPQICHTTNSPRSLCSNFPSPLRHTSSTLIKTTTHPPRAPDPPHLALFFPRTLSPPSILGLSCLVRD